MSIGMDTFYSVVKRADPETFERIVAFASTVGEPHTDAISTKTRYKIERFCMDLVAKRRP